MNWEGKDEALAREAEKVAKDNVTPIRKGRGTRKKNIEAAKAEALGKGVEFDFDGKHYVLDPAEEWDLDVFEAAAEGDILKAVKALVGDDQWQAFRTDDDGDKIKRTLTDLNDFWEEAQKAQGVEPGESNS